MGSKCRRNGLKRLSGEGDMSGHASLKEREKNRERLESMMRTVPPGLVERESTLMEITQLTWSVAECVFVEYFMRMDKIKWLFYYSFS